MPRNLSRLEQGERRGVASETTVAGRSAFLCSGYVQGGEDQPEAIEISGPWSKVPAVSCSAGETTREGERRVIVRINRSGYVEFVRVCVGGGISVE